jgi:hypothetical protein
VGNGQTGILIRGDQVAKDLKNSSKELFEKAAVQPVAFHKPALLNYIKTLQRIQSEPVADHHGKTLQSTQSEPVDDHNAQPSA